MWQIFLEIIIKAKLFFAQNKKEILIFLVIGLGTLALNLIIFSYLFYYFKTSSEIATTYAYWTTVSVHFMLNRVVTFGAGGGGGLIHAFKYLIMLGSNYLLTLLGLWLVATKLMLPPVANIFFSTITNSVASYLLMKYFVFKK